MRIFLMAVKLNLKIFVAYPKGFLISLLIHPIILFMNIFLFEAIFAYNGTSEIKGYSLSQMVWYYVVTMFVYVFIWNFTDRRISNYILSGELGTLLLRPISIYRYELANAVALRIAGILFEFVPGMLIYPWIYPPDFLTPLSLLRFIGVAIMAFLLFFLLNYLIGMTAFVTQNNSGLNRVVSAAISLLGGVMIPLDFFPGWLRSVCDSLPFKYIFYEPIQFFLARGDAATLEGWLRVVGMQAVWALALYALGRALWKMLLKHVVVAGG
ncbi:ABC transporter permease [Cohnella fermenti]|nr:ABC-2 family transporter protein [Cohnella fermenti]